MGYSYETLWDELKQIVPAEGALPKDEIVSLMSSLHLSREQVERVEHLIVPYLAGSVEMEAALV